MAKSLVIVESPAKARTIANYLKNGFEIKASVGHVKDLPESRLGVDIEKGFTPEYQVIKGKIKVLREIKSAAQKAQDIFLATDPDREGRRSPGTSRRNSASHPEKFTGSSSTKLRPGRKGGDRPA